MSGMKDSGIEWIGEMPKTWDLLKGKYIFAQRIQKGNEKNLQLLSPTQKYGVIPQSLYEELTTSKTVKLNEKVNLGELKAIHRGDFCISLRSFQGGFEYSEYEGVVSPAYQVFYPIRPIADGYYKYMFKDRGFIEKMNSYTLSLRDGKNIAFSDFGNTYIPIPPLTEQICIADFLDSKCSEIDALTVDIQKEIDVLEEYKRSIVTEAVTKGINPNVLMKDSGIEWIGEIPQNWEMVSFQHILKERSEKNYPIKTDERLSLSIDKGVTLYADKTTNLDRFKEDVSQYKLAHPGDLIMNSMNMIVGAVGISDYYGCVSPAYYVFYDEDGITARFCDYIFHTKVLQRVLFGLGKGIMAIVRGDDRVNTCRLKVSRYDLNKLKLPIPPIADRIKIVTELDAKCSEVDNIISNKREQLAILEDYKKTVIYEYVTGKKEVPLYES